MRKALVLCVAAAASMAMAAAEEKLGAGVTLTGVTPIADVVKNPDAYAGKTIRIDGTATAVCEMMGCWLALSETGEADSPTIRLKVDHGTIKFPLTAKGKAVSAQGTFEKIAPGDTEAQNAAAEHAKHQAAPQQHAAGHQPAAQHAPGAPHQHDAKAHAGAKSHALEGYQLKATGAIIK